MLKLFQIRSRDILKLPRFIAHRGLHTQLPENSLAAFQAAFMAGFTCFECDVQLHPETGIPVIVHDDINRLNLKKLNLPSLAEVLNFLLTHDIAMNLELKGQQENLAKVVSQVLRPQLPKLQDRLLISSFEFEALLAFQREIPELPLGLLIDKKAFKKLSFVGVAKQYEKLQAYSLNLENSLLNETSIPRFLEISSQILVYTVNDLKRAEYLFEHGITGVFTDSVPELMACTTALEKTITDSLKAALPQIKAIYLFGSVLTPHFNPNSDIDVAFYLEQKISSMERWTLAEELAKQLKHEVDLIDFKHSNTVLQHEILRKGRRIFCRDPLGCDRFELFVLSEYFDLQILRKQQLEDIALRGSIYG